MVFMQDIYVEQLVRRRRTAKDVILRVLVVVLAVILSVVILLVAPRLAPFSMIFYLLFALVVYAAYMLFVSFKVEFEYILTNGDVDVDKIVAQRRRKRLLSFSCKNVQEMGVYDEDKLRNTKFDSSYYVQDAGEGEVWYVVYSNPGKGRVLLVFTGYDRVLDAMKPFLPRDLVRSVFLNAPGKN